MTPNTADIDQALDLLDWLTLGEVLALRFHVNRIMRAAAARRTAGPAGPAVAWDPVERALVYVLFITSDETFARQAAVH
jgi:hypothetical protein